ncbi:uncharacterized protein LOC141619933 [Silene latifolia]|uniref:uncharacterized protein LOC141619933 n=1 Tax=Silene latifolia TaxID=37657 RepID=UPI003D76BF84
MALWKDSSLVKLTHLVFADDLLVFTRGDLPSLLAVDKCLKQFAEMSGLQVNLMKSCLYFGGVFAPVKALILSSSGFVQGDLPVGFLLLTQSYLALIISGGASVLLPKGIVKRINKLCKDFMWGIKDGDRRLVFKSWSSLCKPRHEGGVDIKEILSWNKA